MDLLISKMNLNDLNSIKEFLISDFDDFWNYNILKQELECDNSHFIVVKNKNSDILGFAGLKIIIDEADIMNIVVKKNFRNNGIGTFLLDNLISLAKNLNLCTITLEVSKNNLTAISLYKKFGFKKLGIRKNYYDNIIDGFIMSKQL